MASDATALLFGTYRRQILELLFATPGEALHVREIARRTGIPPGSLHRELRVLAEAGVLERMPVDTQVRYRADQRCRLFEPLTLIFGKPTAANDQSPALRAAEPAAPAYGGGVARVLNRLNVSAGGLGAFARRYGLKRFAFFGSVTRDDFRPDSDVDVLVEFAGPRSDPFVKLTMADELSAMFGGRDVDVVTTGIFRNPIRRASIERDLVTIHGG